MSRGDPRAAEAGRRLFEAPAEALAEDKVRSLKYRFAISAALACRACVEGGMARDRALGLRDDYIRRADRCECERELIELHDAMLRECAAHMKSLARRQAYSRPVSRCVDYIERHLDQPLTLKRLAQAMGLSASYVSILFKRETGLAVSEYIRRSRVEEARRLLRHTDYTCVEIAETLCFSSDSHFSRVFRERVGKTPTEYRRCGARGLGEV